MQIMHVDSCFSNLIIWQTSGSVRRGDILTRSNLMHLARFPRLHFAHLPTPLEPLPRLSKELGGPEIWIKRDDCTGMSSGGNKTRKLEFLMAEAEQQGADIVMTQGCLLYTSDAADDKQGAEVGGERHSQ